MIWLRGKRRDESSTYEEAAAAVLTRVRAANAGSDRAAVHSPAAYAEAGALWRAAWPVDPENPNADEKSRLDNAQYVIGHLYAARLPDAVDESSLGDLLETEIGDLAQAVVLLVPFSGEADHVPYELYRLMGPTCSADAQIATMERLLARMSRHEDPMAARAGIALGLMALFEMAGDDPRFAPAMANLGLFYVMRAEFTQEVSDVESGVQALEFATAAATEANLPDLDIFHDNLNAACSLRWDLSSGPPRRTPGAGLVPADLEDGDEDDMATKLQRSLENSLAELARNQARTSYDTAFERAVEHFNAYSRDGAAPGLEAARQLFQEALSRSRSHPRGRRAGRAEALAHLGVIWLAMYRRTGTRTALDQTIDFGRRSLVPKEPRPHNLGRESVTRPELQRIGHLVAAYDAQLETMDNPLAAGALSALWQRARAAREDLLDVVLISYGDNDPRPLQVRTLHAIGRTAMKASDRATAVGAFRDAIWFLARLLQSAHSWAGQEQTLAAHPALVDEAVSAHLACEDAEGALEMSELGRGIVVSSRHKAEPTPFVDLRPLPADQAQRFSRMRALWSGPPPALARASAPSEDSLTYDDWQRLREALRKDGGVQHFPAPPSWPEALESAGGEAVVLLNVSRGRSDAVLLRPGHSSPEALELERLTPTDIRSFAAELLRPDAGADERDRLLILMLEWLWETTVEPVLTALGHTAPLTEAASKPHINWIASGLLGLMPLHAAQLPVGPSALDRVVTSYSPTLRLLTESRRRLPGTRRHLTIAMSQTPDRADLPGTETEAQSLLDRFPDSPVLSNKEATAARTLEELKQASWVHFACHATSDATAPSRSHLDLHDRALRLPEIAALGLPDAELAYLSACSTARTGWGNPSEATHLASAFHLAGYRHVVAGLWPLNDEAAAVSAQRFYELLGDAPDAGAAAAALHQVTLELRDEVRDRPSLWAPLVHSGPSH